MAKWLPVVGRVLLGGMFVFSGSNGLFHFAALPPPEGDAATLFAGFAASGYMLPLIFGTQLLGGLLVLSGRLTAVGLVLLAPVLVNIDLFHLVLVSKGLGMGLFLTAVELGLAWAYRAAFLPMFASVTPAASAKAEPLPVAAQPAA
jgi:uncharacterized membrane protein YphA (DoxX/SURF4 family)